MNTTQPELPPNPEAGAQQQPTPPAEGELIDLAGYAQAWAAQLDEGTPEERLLGRVAYVLRQRQAPPHEGEVDALIKVLSRIARMFDFMPDGPPNGLIIHRAIELLRQLTPPAEGEVRNPPCRCPAWRRAMTELSPAAQRILDAWAAAKRRQTRTAGLYEPLAAALEALADMDETLLDAVDEMIPVVRAVRTDRILAIAVELRGGFDG